jgi:chromosome segregation protein
MYLKGLELQGFKSFPDRIRLDFNKGITAVVGPNGSGKSNISDAVRWVLGEKSAKTLRGAKMEDIIFNGTEDRKPMGFAEVSLIMDNSDGVLNVDYTEVSVTRKVYRTGESEYLINGKTCRQRDILELFMDTGVGKEGYSIIGQGRIAEILSTKSEDRRNLFEEAAGIVKYKTRCAETQSNLEQVQKDLVRVNDIIAELETQVAPLEKQAEKTKKYLVLAEDLKKIQISIFVDDADRYEEELKVYKGQANKLLADVANSKAEQTRLEQTRENIRTKLAGIATELDKTGEELVQKRAEIEKSNGDIRLCENDVKHISEQIERTKHDIALNNEAMTESADEIKAFEAKATAKSIELAGKQDKYNKRSEELDIINARLSEGEEQLEKYRADMYQRLNRRSELSSRLSELTAVLKQYAENDKSSNELLSGYDGRLQQQEVALAVQQRDSEGVDLECRTITDNMDKLEAEGKRIAALVKETDASVQSKLRQISEKNSRLRALTDIKKDYEGYYGGVKAILKLRDTGSTELRGIKGAVGEVITMPAKLETAIEIALGGAVQNIIADTEEDVKRAIEYLKRTKQGRATFLPMSAVKGRSIGADRQKIINSKGVIGIAKELVDYAAEYEGIMSSLLDRVIVVDNIDNGISLARQTKYTYKIVTLEGDLFNAGGSMTGGSNTKRSAGIFSRTREITELETALTTLNRERQALSDELAKMKARAEDVSESLAEAKEELQALAVKKRECTIKMEHITAEISTIEREKADHIKRMEELSRNLTEAKEQSGVVEKELTEVNAEIDAINEKMSGYDELLKSDKESKDLGNEEIIRMSGEINSLKAEHRAILADIDRTKSDIAALENKNKALASSIEQSQEEINEKNAARSKLTEEMQRLNAECDAVLDKQRTLNEEKSRNTALSEDYEKRVIAVLQTVGSLEKEHTRIRGIIEQTEQKSGELYDRMFNTYEISYVAAKAYPPLEINYSAKKREEARLKGEIRQLGNVNVNAVEEYATIKTRYDHLTEQQTDIIDTEAKLKSIITELRTLMEQQFKEQFAVISKNFARIFSEMFEGGQAKLTLTDTEDVLNCGIDIEAQPPGKALQNIMPLSGGEKAMTAISLLFAILEMKPSPFCILDEIEAALDDANVVRFAEYLRNFTDTTQFIVITHRPGTREVADMLYGVTQERGISKLFSTNLEEIMKERESSGTV